MRFVAILSEVRGARGEIRSFDRRSSQAVFEVRAVGMCWVFFRLVFALIATWCD